jgi:hypothetical protein
VKPGIDEDDIAQTEADHFMECPVCGRTFEMRDPEQVFEHEHDGAGIAVRHVSDAPRCKARRSAL